MFGLVHGKRACVNNILWISKKCNLIAGPRGLCGLKAGKAVLNEEVPTPQSVSKWSPSEANVVGGRRKGLPGTMKKRFSGTLSGLV
jgi:hypothetical protein